MNLVLARMGGSSERLLGCCSDRWIDELIT